MPSFLASSIQVVEEQPQIGTLPELASAVPAFVGLTEKGPLDTPTEISSWDEYLEVFGTYKSGCLLPLATRSFFANGGDRCVILRRLGAGYASSTIALQTPATGATSASVLSSNTETFELAAGDYLDISVDQDPDDQAVFDAAAGYIESNDTWPVSDQDTKTLLLTVDGGTQQSMTFSGSTTTIANVVDQINQNMTGVSAFENSGEVRIASDKQGTDSTIVLAGDNTITWASPVDGTGDVADISAVTAAEAIAVIENDVANCTVTAVGGAIQIAADSTGTGSYIQVQATSTAETKFGLATSEVQGTTGAAQDTLTCAAKYAGVWGDDLQIQITPPTSSKQTGNTAEFNLTVLKSSVVVEVWENLSMLDTATNFAETIINDSSTGSTYITVTDEDCTLTAPADRPDGSYTGDSAVTSDLTSGSDGAAATGATFTGGDDFDALEAEDIDLLAVPDGTSTADRLTIATAMDIFCRVTRETDVFGVCDPPSGLAKAAMRTHGDTLPGSESISVFWPRVRIPNPNKTILGSSDLLVIPPSGTICGIMARNDNDKKVGPFAQPAGVYDGQMLGVVDLESDNHEVIRLSTRKEVYPDRINPITWMKGYGVFVDGVYTKKADGNFPTIGERRGVSHINRTLKTGLQWVRHQGNTSALRGIVERTVYGELLDWCALGAFASMTPSQAFIVDADVPGTGINNARARAQYKLYVRYGIATAKPSEFIILLVSQDTRALQEATLAR
jgi:hypothetical protein